MSNDVCRCGDFICAMFPSKREVGWRRFQVPKRDAGRAVHGDVMNFCQVATNLVAPPFPWDNTMLFR